MSLDKLYQQILLSEQHLNDQTQKFKEVRLAIIRCNERIKSITEKHEKTKEEVDKKAQQLSVMMLQCDLMKKSEDQMLKQIEALLCQNSYLRECLAKIKRESKEEEENFLQEISRFNSDFSLRGNRETVFESQPHTEIQDLEREMELMTCSNSHLSSMQVEKRALQLELQDLFHILKDLDRQLNEADTMTESLRAESLFVSQKHLTDSTCLRLTKELEIMKHKEGDLELQRETLSSEIQFLNSKLDSRQGSEQHQV